LRLVRGEALRKHRVLFPAGKPIGSWSAVFSSQSLRRQELNYIPTLSEVGQAELWILERMKGDATLQSIAQGAFEQFPGLFTSWQAAFDRVAELSKRLSR